MRTRILFIERDPTTRAVVLAAFDRVRYELVLAEGAEVAASLLEAQAFDVLLCELGSAGLEHPSALARFVERIDPFTRCILFIAHDESEARSATPLVKMHYVMTAPIEPAELREDADILSIASRPARVLS